MAISVLARGGPFPSLRGVPDFVNYEVWFKGAPILEPRRIPNPNPRTLMPSIYVVSAHPRNWVSNFRSKNAKPNPTQSNPGAFQSQILEP